MATILDRYGIKEVSDVTFYEIDASTGKPSKPVLYLDTLKTSTIEQSADAVDATGGKGNARLLSWDTNKQITVTLEDALFSAKSMAIMFGDGLPKGFHGAGAAADAEDSAAAAGYIMRTEQFVADSTGATPSAGGWKEYVVIGNKKYTKKNVKFFSAKNVALGAAPSVVQGEAYFCTYDLPTEDGAVVIDVGADTFPGTYYIVGDTYARNAISGQDEFFQWIVPKAKVQASETITMEASGDPSVFNMTLEVLRPDDGIMMKLVKYDLTPDTEQDSASVTSDVYHNHVLWTDSNENSSNG